MLMKLPTMSIPSSFNVWFFFAAPANWTVEEFSSEVGDIYLLEDGMFHFRTAIAYF